MGSNIDDHANVYELLGIAEDATDDEIKKAYKRLVPRTHPDTHGQNPEATAITQELNDARDMLLDPGRRRAYDKKLKDRRELFGKRPTSGSPNKPKSERPQQSRPQAKPKRQPKQPPKASAKAKSNPDSDRRTRSKPSTSSAQGDPSRNASNAKPTSRRTQKPRYKPRSNPSSGQGGRPTRDSGKQTPTKPVDWSSYSDADLRDLAARRYPDGRLKPVAGKDIHVELPVNAATLANGGQVGFAVRRPVACPDCLGTGMATPLPRPTPCQRCNKSGFVAESTNRQVEIPPGSADGESERLWGHGGQGLHGGTAGDLVLTLRLTNEAATEGDGSPRPSTDSQGGRSDQKGPWKRVLSSAAVVLALAMAFVFFSGRSTVQEDGAGTDTIDTTPPPPPIGVTATSGDGEVAVSWNAVNATDLDGYRVYQSESETGPWDEITYGPDPSTTITAEGLGIGTEYWWQVTAQDTAGNQSDPATPASATLSPGPGLSAEDAVELTEPQAAEELRDLANATAPSISQLKGSGLWVPQVSSKCAPHQKADLYDQQRRLGYPDGVTNTYPDGLGSPSILGFHIALDERFGNVFLTTQKQLGQTPDPDQGCNGETLWVSLYFARLNENSRTDARKWCEDQELPTGECAILHFKKRGGASTKY